MINIEFKPMVLTIKLYCLNSISPILMHTEVHWHFGASMRNNFAFPLQMIHFYLLFVFSFLSPLLSGSVSQHSTTFALTKTSNILLVARPNTSHATHSLCVILASTITYTLMPPKSFLYLEFQNQITSYLPLRQLHLGPHRNLRLIGSNPELSSCTSYFGE